MRGLVTTVFLVASVAAVSAQATLIPIANPGFTYAADGSVIGTGTPDRMTISNNTGQWFHDSAWNWYPNTIGGIQGWTGAEYSNADYGNAVENKRGNTGPYDGAMTFLNGTEAWNYLEQRASVNNITIQAGTYTLKLDAQQWDGANLLSACFTANDALAGTVQSFSVSNNGSWSTVTAATLVVAIDSPYIGQKLGFHLNGGANNPGDSLGTGGAMANNPQIDNVALDFVSVPEPASIGLLAGASLLMLARRRNVQQ